jgi:putative transposase
MIDPEHNLPIQKQAEVLAISRSTVYYQPRTVPAEDLWQMRQIDELHLNYPFAAAGCCAICSAINGWKWTAATSAR